MPVTYTPIKRQRRSKKITQQEMAKRMGLPLCRYRQIELGQRHATVDQLNKLAQHMSVTVTDLLADDDAEVDECDRNEATQWFPPPENA